MYKTNFLYCRIKGWTATFKMPLFFSSSGIKSYLPTLTIPPYSTILGILGNIVGKDLNAADMKKIGFMFEYEDKDNIDIEKIISFKLDDNNITIKENRGQSNPSRREFLVRPTLHLFLEDINYFKENIENPFNIPCLGRSQDIAWIDTLNNGKQYEIVEAIEVDKGKINNTLIPFPQEGASGIIYPLVENYNNFSNGNTRKPSGIKTFQFINNINEISRSNLFKVSNFEEYVIYMHDFNLKK